MVQLNVEDQPSTSNNNTYSPEQSGPRGKKARIQRLADAVKEVRKVQEALTNSKPLNENEAFGQFVAASLCKLPPGAAIMAQGEILTILQKYKLQNINKISSSNCKEVSELKDIVSLAWNLSNE